MSELEQQIENRRAKRAALEAAGIEPFPHKFDYDLEPSEVQAQYGEATAEELEDKALRLRVPGRLRALRKHGKTAFADLRDGTGKIQLMIRTKQLEGDSATVFENLDLGDIVGAEGSLIRTRTGELTLQVETLTLLAKAVRPLPEKWHGLTDVEARYRQRYLDLIVNSESRLAFEQRARMIRSIRHFMDERGFLEIETPMMQAMAGGATARPFATHHNALDLPLYLRVAPELYHKRLIVGGIHKVYEINRNFRNEGISTQHNPEFTALEFYWAYADFQDVMQLTEDMIVQAARDVLGRSEGEITLTFRGVDIDLSPGWPQMRMDEALVEFAGVAPERLETAEGLTAELKERDLPLPKATSYGNLMMHLFEETVEDQLQQPIFITHHPIEVSPLTKISRLDPRFTERFELYIAGMEMANAFTELNDPEEQARRFEQQLTARAEGDDEAHQFDADYVRALEHGMPPTGGQGMGIDRLAMLLTGKDSIRDVIFFPLMRPKTAGGTDDSSEEE